MLTLDSSIGSHVEGPTTNLVTCWKVTLDDGTVIGFTDHNTNLSVAGVTYRAAGGYNASSIVQTCGFAVDNHQIESVIDGDNITREDVVGGRWDGAVIERFQVNFRNTAGGTIPLSGITLGSFQVLDQVVAAEALGVKQAISQPRGDLVQLNCRYVVGDEKCQLVLVEDAGAITSLDDNANVYDTNRVEADDHYSEGVLRFTSGENSGLSIEVRDFENAAGEGKFIFVQEMPYQIQVGDTYVATLGCRRTEVACKALSNFVNYGGEPHVPGLNRFLSAPSQ